jgi:hypothetical protein
MSELSNQHYALVLRELSRFARLWNATLAGPAAGKSAFRLSNLCGAQSGANTHLARFEASTGGGHGTWLTLSDAPASNLERCLKEDRGLVRRVNVWRWRWLHYHAREEAMMWLGLAGLRVAHERWVDRAKAELLVVEAPGRTFSAPALVHEQARVLQEFLKVFASLQTEVVISNAVGDAQYGSGRLQGGAPQLSASDEWSRVRSCDIEVRVLGELPTPAPVGCLFAEEAASD